jgi:tyrosyl-tRNA synthetase
LAFKVTQIIHGTKQAQLAEKLSEFLFGRESKLDILASLDQEQLKTFQKEVGGKKYEQEDILDLLVNTNLSPSR